MARRGTAGLTVCDIAREARVADGVLYNHFADKEDLLAQALHAHVRSVERSLGDLPEQAGTGGVEDNLRAYIAHGLALHTGILPASRPTSAPNATSPRTPTPTWPPR